MVDRINLILKAKNITAKQFAEEIGIQPSGMSHILSGRNNPSLDFVMKVIRRYPEIDINWLMFGKGEMYENPALTARPRMAGDPPAARPATQVENANSMAGGSLAEGRPLSASYRANPLLRGGDTASGVGAVADSAGVETVAKGVPDLFSASQELTRAGVASAKAVPAASAPVSAASRPSLPGAVAVPARQVEPPAAGAGVVANGVSQPPAAVLPQLDESRADLGGQPRGGKNPILAQKRIAKVVILYEDHSFSEYYPE